MRPEPAGGLPVLWSGASYRRDDWALLTGFASHLLDFDDVSMRAICHPTGPVLSAALAAMDWDTTGGDELCDAVAVGTEVMVRVGEAAGLRPYALGFHATSVFGIFGAAAAAARLSGLDKAQTQNALAISASLAGGLRINFGSMTKSLHVGQAAANGLRAATWSKAGVSGSSADIFGPAGVFSTLSGGEVSGWDPSVALGLPFVIEQPGFERKRFPCCYLLHRMVAAAIRLSVDHDLHLEDIDVIDVVTPPGGTLPLIYPRPTTGREAQFSGPYAVLAAIRDRRFDFTSISDGAVNRQDIQARLGDVVLIEAGNEALSPLELGQAPVTVTVRLKNGRAVSWSQNVAPGSSDDPFDQASMAAKWGECLLHVQPTLPAAQAQALFDTSQTLSSSDPIGPWLLSIRDAINNAEPASCVSVT